MNIITAEFQATIQGLIDNLQSENMPDAEEYKLAAKHNALPIGLDLFSYVFLKSDGEIIWDDNEGETESATDLQSLIRVLVGGKRRYPQLEKFVPNRCSESKTCPVCEGSGTMPHSKQISTGKPRKCFVCADLGWVTEESWKNFTENQEINLNNDG